MPEYSPFLALVTGAFEIVAAVYAFSRPGRPRILRPVGVIFLLLAGYQFAEVAVCARPEALILSRLAYLDILWLPPVSLWLVSVLDAARRKWLKAAVVLYFAAGIGFSVWILVDPACITRSVCQVVVARYLPSAAFDVAFGLFYQTALAVIVFGAGIAMASAVDPVLRKHLANFQLGVLGFVFPSVAVRILAEEPAGLLPSVMCHFALVLAASLVALVVRERRSATSDRAA